MEKDENKITPYRTSTGIMIGQFYERRQSIEYSPDMELVQVALINDQDFKADIRRKEVRQTGVGPVVRADLVGGVANGHGVKTTHGVGVAPAENILSSEIAS